MEQIKVVLNILHVFMVQKKIKLTAPFILKLAHVDMGINARGNITDHHLAKL